MRKLVPISLNTPTKFLLYAFEYHEFRNVLFQINTSVKRNSDLSAQIFPFSNVKPDFNIAGNYCHQRFFKILSYLWRFMHKTSVHCTNSYEVNNFS